MSEPNQVILSQIPLSQILEGLRAIIREEIRDEKGSETPVAKEIIDTKLLIKRLGITEPTVIRWRKKGKIPFLNIGSAIRYDYNAVLKALESKKK